ncbi:alpha-galactosidase [Streptomyces nogalater]
MLGRTDQVWTSDNTDPLDRLAIQHGFTQLHPARVMAAWVTDSPNTQLNGRARCASGSSAPWRACSGSAAT